MTTPRARIDLLASAPQYLDHLGPVWHALPKRARGRFLMDQDLVPRATDLGISAEVGLDGTDRPTLVASYGDLRRVRDAGCSHVELIEHGIAQSYGGDRDWAHRSSYPGGRGRDADLFLHPNETSAARDRTAYPEARVEVVGCPKLDALPTREPGPGPVIGVAFHWDGAMPELRWAWPRFRHAIVRLAAKYTIIGHGHPRAMKDLAPWYQRAGIEVVADFAEVCRRANLLVFDNTSVGFEFAATGRPVVCLEPYHYRRGVHHGLRFWDAVPGVVCQDRAGVPDAVSLTAVVERALEDPPEAREARERALELVYAYRSGAAERASKVLLDWAKNTAATTRSDDDGASPVGATVGPRGADADQVAPVGRWRRSGCLMPVLTAADFEAMVDSGIDTATIEAAIDREEAALARSLGGPLEGERTDTLYPAGHDGPLTLRRFATSVTVTSDGQALGPSDARLIADGRGRPGGAIERASGAWGDVVAITSTPDDADAVKQYLIEAVRRALVPDSERAIGEGRSAAGAAIDTGRALLRRYLRDLQPQTGSASVPVRISDRVTP